MIPSTDKSLVPLAQIALEYSYDDLAKSTNNFSQSSQLGQGTYGSVYKGCLREGTEVAIKVLPQPKESGFREEVEVLSKFRHPNLVILMGFARWSDGSASARTKTNNPEVATWGPSTRFLVYELLDGGDVCARITNVPGASPAPSPSAAAASPTAKFPLLDWRQRIAVLLDSALGLSHLHNARPQVFHRDIKSQNILLDKNGSAKMADFGLALLAAPAKGTGGAGSPGAGGQAGSKLASAQAGRYVTESAAGKVRSGVKVDHTSGTIGYADPLYISTGVVTEKSEVYSFGMVMLELLTATPPA